VFKQVVAPHPWPPPFTWIGGARWSFLPAPASFSAYRSIPGYARGSFLVADKNSCAITLLSDEWPRLPSPRASTPGRGDGNSVR
jgi:hypothetical protein